MLTTTINSAQYDLSEIFSNAWLLVRKAGASMSDALKSAWAAARKSLTKLNMDVAKLSELSVQELREISAAILAVIDMKEDGDNQDKKYAHKIKLEEENGKIYTTSYYNDAFVSKARGLRGSWSQGQWVFDESVREHVIAAMEQCYGVTGILPYQVCTLTVKEYRDSVRCAGVELFGRPVAKAFGRDSGAKAGEDIFLINGKFQSGGSVKNWRTEVTDATFEIHNFPIAALTREDVKEAIEAGWVQVK